MISIVGRTNWDRNPWINRRESYKRRNPTARTDLVKSLPLRQSSQCFKCACAYSCLVDTYPYQMKQWEVFAIISAGIRLDPASSPIAVIKPSLFPFQIIALRPGSNISQEFRRRCLYLKAE